VSLTDFATIPRCYQHSSSPTTTRIMPYNHSHIQARKITEHNQNYHHFTRQKGF